MHIWVSVLALLAYQTREKTMNLQYGVEERGMSSAYSTTSGHCYYTQIKEEGRVYDIQINKKTGLANLWRSNLIGAMAFRS